MEYKIEELQRLLNVSDEMLCEKLNITQCRLTLMKINALRNDYLHVKSVLVHERAKMIKYLK